MQKNGKKMKRSTRKIKIKQVIKEKRRQGNGYKRKEKIK